MEFRDINRTEATKVALKELKKDQLIELLFEGHRTYENTKDDRDRSKRTMEQTVGQVNSAKIILAALVGDEIPKNEYYPYEPEYDKFDLLELIGKTISKVKE